ncbi:hypothetical protein MBOE_20050 [Mycolicibacterium boenickei]|uniref:Uncharacterized protein n=1 Tax=Mycolicibacterium boenickei TaxID=146017 RepID=A0ABM7IU43_9MYCO|nr:hypothetical protein MBOE_20050 [Mycolicibacterium boenickei]
MGAFPGRPGARPNVRWGCGGWTGQRSAVELFPGVVGDDESVCGTGDGDLAAVVGTVVIGADQDEIGDKFLIYPPGSRPVTPR